MEDSRNVLSQSDVSPPEDNDTVVLRPQFSDTVFGSYHAPVQRAHKALEQVDVRSQSHQLVVKPDRHYVEFTFPLKLRNFVKRNFHHYYLYFTCLKYIIYFVLYNVYMFFAIPISWGKSRSTCDGIQLVAIASLVIMVFMTYFCGIKPLFFKRNEDNNDDLLTKISNRFPFLIKPLFRICSGVAICILIITIVLIHSQNRLQRLVSFSGVLVLIFLGFLFSKNPMKIDWSLVVWGITLQFICAFTMLRWPTGRATMSCINNFVIEFISYSDKGTSVLFSYLVTGEFTDLPNQFFVLAFKIFTIVIFFGLVTSILFYYGVLQWIVIKLGWFLHVIIGSTAIESMTAAANIFLGMTEAPLTVKPYLDQLTKAEIHSVMTGGFATIAGTVLVAYIAMGIQGTHLVIASVMSAPAALAYAKLMYPETEESVTTPKEVAKMDIGLERTCLEAAVQGVQQGLLLTATIIANLIAFMTMIKLVDSILEWLGSLVGFPQINTQLIFSYLFTPLAFIMGVDWQDCGLVAELIGIKTVVNEFVAFIRLIDMRKENKLSFRSEMIATYALCGFSNLGSIGIEIGGLSSLVPERMADISSLAMRAMIAGSAASFLTACVAGGLLLDDD